MTSRAAIASETLRGLLLPKRLIPVFIVSASLVLAEARFSYRRQPLAILLATLACIAFVLVAPLAFRLLFPDEERTPGLAHRIALYFGLALTVNVLLEIAVPRAFAIRRTFLGDPVSVGVSVALFLVGGWGLGRDIGFEASLRRERARTEAFAKEAEAAQLLALRAHFDPHFLFNTLNAIAEWCREDGETAEKAIVALSSMLREVLRGVRAPSWSLDRELGLVEALFSLHQIRDTHAFTLEQEVDPEVKELPIVPLLLLPLAENAVKHGPTAGHRGIILLRAKTTGPILTVEIENPGPYAGPRHGSDGLPLVRRRLAAAYGAEASLEIAGVANVEGPRTRVIVTLPSIGPLPGVTV